MSTITKAIASRKSIYPYQFLEKEIPQDVLERILTYATYAPSHRKTFPWRFYVFTEDRKTALGEFLEYIYQKITPAAKFSEFKQKKILAKALQSGAVLAICMQRDPKNSVPEWEEMAATAMAVQNIWLVLEQEGLGGYWSTPSLKDYLHEFIQLPEGQQCLGFFYLGYVANTDSQEKKLLTVSEYVTFNPKD